MNYSQKEKQKTTTVTIKISKLSFVMLVSAVLALSSIAAAQLLSTNNNAAFAALRCSEEPPTSEGTVDFQCSGGLPLTGGEEGKAVGGFGGHSTCTVDTTTPTLETTCASSGGQGTGIDREGIGGRSVCTFIQQGEGGEELPPDYEPDCSSFNVGGGSP